MIWSIIIQYIFINICFDVYEFRKRFISAGLLVSLGQLLMFVGIVKIVDFHYVEDTILIFVYFVGYVVFLLAYLGFIRGYTFSSIRYDEKNKISLFQKRVLYCMIIASSIVSIAFFVLSGVNIIHTIFDAIIHGMSVDISQLRKAINYTRGNGIVYQLRNFIIPLPVMYLIIFEKGLERKIGLFFLPIAFVLLIGSGQRAGLVYLIIIIVIAIMYSIKIALKNGSFSDDVKKRKRSIVLLSGMFIIAFILLTVLNGRDNVSGSLIKALEDRFIYDNQACAIIAFRYIYNSRIVFGYDWYNMFVDLFRENQYIPVAALIHEQMYGSLTGTAPPCIWGSAYYNFGYFGVVFIALVLAAISSKLYIVLCRQINNNLRLLMFLAMSVLLATWMADSPVMLLNGGFSTVWFMTIVLFPIKKIRL